jgi:GT2 family glycosyltransferase
MISIVTAVYNKQELTRTFWESLKQFPPSDDWEIIWIDDNSDDKALPWLDSNGTERFRIIRNEVNRGFAYSNNLGARQAAGEILVLINNDAVLTPGWFESLIKLMKMTNQVGMVGNIQLQPATGRIDHAGVCYDLIGRPDHYLKGCRLAAARGLGRFSTAVTAACCMIRRDLFLSVGGFDERFRNGCEDVDLCLRLGEMGYRHWVDYRSVIYHHVSSSPGRKDHEKQNLALFLQRWGHLTAKWGQVDWPRNYLSKHLHCPWKLNGTKTVDALLRLAGLKHGDSKWAAEMRQKIMVQIAPKAPEVDINSLR